MARSHQQIADECAMVTGHLIHGWASDPGTGEHIASLTPEQGQKVIAGYACGNSVCFADYGVMYRVVCPICGFDRRIETPDKFMVPVPALWAEHIAARQAAMDDPDPKPKKFPSMEQAILGLQHDPNVENVPLSKLMPSKHGRGRT